MHIGAHTAVHDSRLFRVRSTNAVTLSTIANWAALLARVTVSPPSVSAGPLASHLVNSSPCVLLEWVALLSARLQLWLSVWLVRLCLSYWEL